MASHSDYFRLIKTEIWAFEGPDALRFLNGVSTPDLKRAASVSRGICGRGLFLDPKGRLLAPFVYLKNSEQSVRLRLDIGCHTRDDSAKELNQSLYDHINKLVIADRLTISRTPVSVAQVWSSEISEHHSQLPLEPARPLALDLLYHAHVYRGNACLPVPHLGEDAFEIWPNQGTEAPEVSGVEMNAEQVAEKFFKAKYLEFPNQLHVGDLPLEFGFQDAISFFKGCYRGQEIIARVTYRGKLAKGLCELEFDAAVDSKDNQLMNAEGQMVGEVRVLDESRHRGLGLLRFEIESDVFTAGAKVPVLEVKRLVKAVNEAFR